jgi:hypothetical protein
MKFWLKSLDTLPKLLKAFLRRFGFLFGQRQLAKLLSSHQASR